MKFTTTREALLAPLQRVSGVIEKRQTLPVLSNVLMELDGGKLTLTGTDLEIQMTASATVDTEQAGSVTLPAKKLLDIVRLLPDGAPVSVELNGGGQDTRALVKSGRSRYQLGTLPADSYPAFDGGSMKDSVTIDGQLLKRALGLTQFAMAISDVRYYLNGMLLDVNGKAFKCVSSDGHRLALYTTYLDENPGSDRQCILPRKGVLELVKLLKEVPDPVTMLFGDNVFGLETPGFGFTAKLIDGRFPDINRVMPRDMAHQITVNTANLKDALNRVSVMSESRASGLEMQVDENGIKLSMALNNEDAQEFVDCQLEGGNVSIGMNPSYLLEAINAVETETITLSLPATLNACLIEQPGNAEAKYLVMPMKL
jgi:DNA polymerase-3 subunit beta